jgi:hypothetical protein
LKRVAKSTLRFLRRSAWSGVPRPCRPRSGGRPARIRLRRVWVQGMGDYRGEFLYPIPYPSLSSCDPVDVIILVWCWGRPTGLMCGGRAHQPEPALRTNADVIVESTGTGVSPRSRLPERCTQRSPRVVARRPPAPPSLQSRRPAGTLTSLRKHQARRARRPST